MTQTNLRPNDSLDRSPDESGERVSHQTWYGEGCVNSWVIEGSKGGQFHAINRYCDETDSLRTVALYLVKLSRLGVKPFQL